MVARGLKKSQSCGKKGNHWAEPHSGSPGAVRGGGQERRLHPGGGCPPTPQPSCGSYVNLLCKPFKEVVSQKVGLATEEEAGAALLLRS